MLSAEEEIRRLEGDLSGSPTPEMLFNVAFTASDPTGVLERVRDAILSIVHLSTSEIEEEASRPKRLPSWLVVSFAPEQTEEEVANWLAWWRSLGNDARAGAEEAKGWTLPDWLYWMTPGERAWAWWDAALTSPTSATITVEADGWPTPIGALRWLIKAAGAEVVSNP
ncbi:hypothetical protein [Cellulomonas xiejunii]|uniref:Uncharacterized protein n=1 Tax=Cellulomonas xiejunii TaxID=2968083 RepID=A0ABY5KNV3_9CELL|nr:hypothetical protein [Cellulomonas xiejunii]MCC2319605.1 hypothetical protein [Cellulomonas xiejunii]UUI71454.1 hypothetical protein NP048_16925 [Cellulomonas xiejunii]